MDEEIIRRWNSRVTADDVVFHLGDFSLSKGSDVKKYMARLNGTIVWIKGNHDSKTIIKDLTIQFGGKMWQLVHEPQDSAWEFVLHGHVHNNWKIKKTHRQTLVNVGVDVHNFYPITMNEIIEAIKDE